ncbi:Neugrin [Nesidiocoris tenuis]|uniref:Neugrin n=1 Tax=Nesidiocoris tenuis TaxID=355587 RepID=A0ABN7AAW4_9HEMI|nr:Neugrin [Nesidiocoris tenuis]
MELVRSIFSRSTQFRFYRANAGVGRRLKLIKEGNPELKGVKLEDKSFDDLDVDAFDAKLLKEEYEKEYDRTRKRIEFKRIERQYFERKQKTNFLLWSEKEQIRQLHQSDPDQWSFQRLAESFPATPAVIKKIVAARWKMRDVAQMQKHDDRVVATWKAFQEGKITLLQDEQEHLSKFLSRDRSQRSEVPIEGLAENRPRLTPTKRTEFLDIVACQKKPERSPKSIEIQSSKSIEIQSSKSIEIQPAVGAIPANPSETYVLGGQLSRQQQRKSRHYTLAELRTLGVAPGTPTPDENRTELKSNAEATTPKIRQANLNPTNFASVPKRPVITKSSQDILMEDSIEENPVKISIPKEKWKKGVVYRVNNCFYADDGEFLYKI